MRMTDGSLFPLSGIRTPGDAGIRALGEAFRLAPPVHPLLVTSIPKSGTQLLYAILEDLFGPPGGRIVKPPLGEPIAGPIAGPYCLGGHLRYFPERALPPDVRVVALIRDPRAVLLSMRDFLTDPARKKPGHLALARKLAGLSFEEQLISLTDGMEVDGHVAPPLSSTCGGFVDWPGVNLVRYEELFRGDGGEILAAALGVNADLSGAIARRLGTPTATFNVGDPDRWRSAIPPEVLSYVEDHAGDRIAALGYSLDTRP
jgi:hypothetical protein